MKRLRRRRSRSRSGSGSRGVGAAAGSALEPWLSEPCRLKARLRTREQRRCPWVAREWAGWRCTRRRAGRSTPTALDGFPHMQFLLYRTRHVRTPSCGKLDAWAPPPAYPNCNCPGATPDRWHRRLMRQGGGAAAGQAALQQIGLHPQPAVAGSSRALRAPSPPGTLDSLRQPPSRRSLAAPWPLIGSRAPARQADQAQLLGERALRAAAAVAL
jgi:hypothetical protein